LHAVYEYVFTTLIFILIFTASIASLLNIIETPMRHIKQQQLYSTAETVLDALLGTPGDPKDWGSNVTLRAEDLRILGLSKGLKTDIIYDLDPDKLARLGVMGTGASINESTLSSLLNLGGSESLTAYGFSLTLTPVLNISVTPTGWVGEGPNLLASSFLVTVTTHEEIPVGNVNLTAYITTAYEVVSTKTLYYVTNETKHGVTFWNGTYEFDYTQFMEDLLSHGGGNRKLASTVLVVIGDFFGIKTMATFDFGSPDTPLLRGMLLGKYIIFDESDFGPNPTIQIPLGPDGFMHAAEITFNSVIDTLVDQSTLHGSCPWLYDFNNRHFKVMELKYLEPDIYRVAFMARAEGWQGLALVTFSRMPEPGFRIGSSFVPRGNRVVAIRRVAFVNDMAFFADFYFWRKYEVEV